MMQSTKVEYIPNDPGQYFYTFDLGCAAALACMEYDLIALDKTNPRKAQFIFSRDSEGIDEAVQRYFSSEGLSVNARGYFDALRMLKTRLYSV